jgi:hypothetical protein
MATAVEQARGMSDKHMDSLVDEVGPEATARLLLGRWMSELREAGFTFEEAVPLMQKKLATWMAATSEAEAEREAAFFACHPAD